MRYYALGVLGMLLVVGLFMASVASEPEMLSHPGELRNRFWGLASPLLAPSLDTADLEPIAFTSASPFGVNTFLEQEVEEEKIRRTLRLAQQAGFTWIRQEFPWRDIEMARKGDFWDYKWNKSAWEKYDRIVALAQEYSLQIIARLDAPPDWSRQDNRLFQRPPDNYEDFGDFVHAIVSRYKGRVRYYQIWNEPNIFPEWGYQPVNAAEYTRLLQIAYRRAKEADPDCVIIAAALAPTIAHEPFNRSDILFLEEMYAAGARGYFDILSTMAYGLLSGPEDRRADPWRDVNFSRPMLLRQVMVRNGDAHKPIWISELGWNALPPDFPEEPRYGRVTDRQQARYTVRGLQRILEEWPWVGVINIWYLRQPGNWLPSQQEYYFRMVDPDFTVHPVYEAVRAFATRPPVMERGYRQEDHYALTYTGSWSLQKDPRASLGGYYQSTTPGDAVSFTFHGTDLDLVARRGPDGGMLQVWVDDLPASHRQLPRDAQGRPYADLYAPAEEWQALIPLAHGLPDGEHRVVLTVSERNVAAAGNRVVIDGLLVDRKAGFPTLLLWLGAAIIALWAVAWRVR